MRVLFVMGSLVHGGAERQSITVMNRLAERGHECHAAYVKNDPSQLERIRLGGDATVQCLEARRFLDGRAVDALGRLLRRIRPSVIVAANGFALMYASLANGREGLHVPVTVTFHTTQVLGAREQAKSLIDRFFFWRSQCAVFVCERQRRYWLRRGLLSRRNEVIYNGVDTKHFRDSQSADERRALRASMGFSDDDYVIGLSAVLRPEKNHGQLVDAIARLRQGGLPARALMIGDGPERSVVEARALELGLQDDIKISGFKSDVRPCVSLCDVMVLCSRSETFSLAALEAMAMNRPVVHADLGGAAEMITPGHNGFLFPVGDTTALTDRLQSLANRRLASAMGMNARRTVEERFSEAAMIDSYERLLDNVCRAHRGPSRAGTKPEGFMH